MTATATELVPGRPKGSWLWKRQLDHYPDTGRRVLFLGITVLATVMLYYELYVGGSVATLLLSNLGMSFSFYVVILAFGNLLGAFGSLAAGLADRWGRANLVVGGLLLTAVEEFLRAYAPVTMARLVKEDMHWRGVDMKADDWILLSFPAANRDPAQFDRAGEVVIDREVNRHAAFGLGIHRCLGSHLARMELRVALEAWLERIPEFSLDDPAAVKWSAGQIRGPRRLPLRIG